MTAQVEPNSYDIDAPENRPIAIHNGLMVDAETGEVLGRSLQPQFDVVDRDSLEWVLRKMQELDAMAAGIASDPEVRSAFATLNCPSVLRARAIVANAERMQNDLRKRRESMERRWQSGIIRTVNALLDGSSARTLKTLFGAVSLRRSPGSIKIVSEGEAIQWAEEHAPHAIKATQALLVSQLKDYETSELPPSLLVVEPHDTVKIETGVTP